MLRTFALAVSLAALAASAAPAQDAAPAADPAAAAALEAAIAGAHRSEADRARDQYRNPKETLLFFGFRPDMTVVEIAPGGGWYTEILAPALRARGRYIAAFNNPDASPEAKAARDAFAARFANRDLYGDVTVANFGPGIMASMAAPNSVDLVVTFRAMHGLIGRNLADEAFAAFYTVLKPGGRLGIEQHRQREDREPLPGPMQGGYIKESQVIALAEKAGFRLVGRSEINANPKDTADWPQGVWTLPPTLALKDQDREKYLAIGESDRMTLLFEKPAR
ncbi:MAG: methyltransferase domain-containing protein [Sphingomonadaceae bacterium]